MYCRRKVVLTSCGVNLTLVPAARALVMRRQVIPFWYFFGASEVPPM
jgi:hypothetical protein